MRPRRRRQQLLRSRVPFVPLLFLVGVRLGSSRVSSMALASSSSSAAVTTTSVFAASSTARRRSSRRRRSTTTTTAAAAAAATTSTTPKIGATATATAITATVCHSNDHNDPKEEGDPTAVLHAWLDHRQADYHQFTDPEARAIRSALLDWYPQQRRHLPWRGDPPPYDGSTAGMNTNTTKTMKKSPRKKRKKPEDHQPAITTFFASTATHSKTTNTTPRAAQNEKTKNSEPEKNSRRNWTTPHEGVATVRPGVSGYGIWVSEIMLQQTRVEAVIPFWLNWMQAFPTVYALAAATEDDVNAHWAGLGFYRRARYLHQGAQYVVEQLEGELPQSVDGLLKISGIGPYTASAIASIAYDVCVPVVDGNVCRVLARLTGIAHHIKAPILKDKVGWQLAAQIVEAGDATSPGIVNQALMELGATYCAPNGSGIDARDPLRDYYRSTQLGRAYLAVLQAEKEGGHERGRTAVQTAITAAAAAKSSTTVERHTHNCCELCDPDGRHSVLEKFRDLIIVDKTTMDEAARIGHSVFPTNPPKKEKREEDLAMAVIVNRCTTDDNDTDTDDDSTRYLMVRRPKQGLLAGQWEFPNVCTQIREKTNTNKKLAAKVPKTKDRAVTLTEFLSHEVFGDDPSETTVSTAVSNLRRRADTEPLEHIFSHVKHYMWLEVGDLTDIELQHDDLKWVTPAGKEVRWMNKGDMKKVGITSGVKKVLRSIEKKASIISNGNSIIKSKTKPKIRKK